MEAGDGRPGGHDRSARDSSGSRGKRRGLPPAGRRAPKKDPGVQAEKDRKRAEQAALRKKRADEKAALREKRAADRSARRDERQKRDQERRVMRKKQLGKKEGEREAQRRKRRREREERTRVRRAKREARRLAVLLGIQEMARRFGRLVWPAHTRRLPRAKAVLVLVLNIAPLPGLGTGIYGKWERGVMQFLLTFVFLLGWVWAIMDGVRVVLRAFEPQRRGLERAKRAGAARRQQ